MTLPRATDCRKGDSGGGSEGSSLAACERAVSVRQQVSPSVEGDGPLGVVRAAEALAASSPSVRAQILTTA